MSEKTTHQDIKAVIFDLGRVLLNIDNMLLVGRLFKGIALDDPQLVQKTIKNEPMIEFNSGRMSPEEFHRKMCVLFNLTIDYESFIPLWCSIFSPMDGMKNLVMRLQNKVRLGLLSDTDPVHWDYVKKNWPWLDVFEKPTLSFEVGVMKPNPHIFLTAAQSINTPPENCLYVDDLQDNVEGARAIGMTAVKFENPAQIEDVLRGLRLL